MNDNNDILQLSNDHSIEVDSHAFYKHPIQFKNSSSNKVMSFSTMFAFDLINEHGNQGRHHFAFIIFPSGALPGPYLGELNSKNNGNILDHVFMVAFTVTHPKFSDIDDNHVVVGLIQESTDAATGVHHQCLTRGVVGNAATRISVLFFLGFVSICVESNRFGLNRFVSASRNLLIHVVPVGSSKYRLI